MSVGVSPIPSCHRPILGHAFDDINMMSVIASPGGGCVLMRASPGGGCNVMKASPGGGCSVMKG